MYVLFIVCLHCSVTNSVRGLLTVVSGSDGSPMLQNEIEQALNTIGSQFIPTFTAVEQLMPRFSVSSISRYGKQIHHSNKTIIIWSHSKMDVHLSSTILWYGLRLIYARLSLSNVPVVTCHWEWVTHQLSDSALAHSLAELSGTLLMIAAVISPLPPNSSAML